MTELPYYYNKFQNLVKEHDAIIEKLFELRNKIKKYNNDFVLDIIFNHNKLQDIKYTAQNINYYDKVLLKHLNRIYKKHFIKFENFQIDMKGCNFACTYMLDDDIKEVRRQISNNNITITKYKKIYITKQTINTITVIQNLMPKITYVNISHHIYINNDINITKLVNSNFVIGLAIINVISNYMTCNIITKKMYLVSVHIAEQNINLTILILKNVLLKKIVMTLPSHIKVIELSNSGFIKNLVLKNNAIVWINNLRIMSLSGSCHKLLLFRCTIKNININIFKYINNCSKYYRNLIMYLNNCL